MKKRVILSLLIILILIISVGSVNAGWFGNFLNRITGKVTEDETEIFT